jgi:Serine/threonine protein kinase
MTWKFVTSVGPCIRSKIKGKRSVEPLIVISWNICHNTLDLAPEIVDHVEYDKSVDIWCLGILFYEMVYGFPPFASKSKEETFDKIKKKVLIFRDDIQVLSDSAKDLMKKVILGSKTVNLVAYCLWTWKQNKNWRCPSAWVL